MGDTQATPIIQLVGPKGSGKTTLCRLFLDSFLEKTVLAVDTSIDSYLTLSFGVNAPTTVSHLLTQFNASPITHEAIDWALQDLPVPVASESEAEILAWGAVPESLSEKQLDILKYGLPRLLRTYDVVIWDGPLGAAESALPSRDIQPLLVITPNDEAYCQTLHLDHAMILLSKAEASDSLPPTAALHIQRGNWKFLGKLPPLNPPEKRIKELPHYFQECFHKLDLPFDLRPRLA